MSPTSSEPIPKVTVIEGASNVEIARFLAIRRGLKLEVETGMHNSKFNVKQIAAQLCNSKKRSRVAVLREFQDWLKQHHNIEPIEIKTRTPRER